jgi:taurine dioxygenase
VLVFPEQDMSDDDLERFTLGFGGFGEDPFIAPIEGREHIIALSRRADEQAPLFAENWHTDWSFQQLPPAGTCLFAITIPPTGGDTLFANQHKALAQMPAALRSRLEGLVAIHSAAAAYAPDGMYGEADKATDRSMNIVPSETAREVYSHPLLRNHPETGEAGLFGCIGYISGFEGVDPSQSLELLLEVHEWQTRTEFQYQHQWSEKMLVMWDNRSVLHRASGGYEGYDRLLHRTTVADRSV